MIMIMMMMIMMMIMFLMTGTSTVQFDGSNQMTIDRRQEIAAEAQDITLRCETVIITIVTIITIVFTITITITIITTIIIKSPHQGDKDRGDLHRRSEGDVLAIFIKTIFTFDFSQDSPTELAFKYAVYKINKDPHILANRYFHHLLFQEHQHHDWNAFNPCPGVLCLTFSTCRGKIHSEPQTRALKLFTKSRFYILPRCANK